MNIARRWGGSFLLLVAATHDWIARRAGGLLSYIFLTCLAFTLVTLVLLAFALLRRSIQETAQFNRSRGRAVTAATVASALALVGLLGASVHVGRSNAETEHAPGELEIEVTGHQWWWSVRYPAATPSETVVTANELHVPVGQQVRLMLTSDDVIHSFWVPQLNGKRDLIPGRVTTLVSHADRPGVFVGQCAEFCGFQHAHMGLLVVAEESGTFDAWLAAQRLPASAPVTANDQHGQAVFKTACALCHAIRGADAFGHLAPDLTHFAGRRSIAAMMPNTPGHLAGWIADPQRLKPGTHMPPNPLPGADLTDLVSYLESLR